MRKEVELLIAVGGIYFCYFKAGLIQEHLFKSNFGTMDFPSPKFQFSSILIMLQMLFYHILCMIMVKKNKVKFVCTYKEGLYLGFFNFSSMIGALTALQFVSFPLQALTKSCKILSVLIVGLVLGNQKFTRQQILCGLIITVGIYAFNLSEGSASNKTSSIFGIILLLTSLFSDGCLATLQSKFKVKKIEQWEMGYHISLWGFIGSICYTLLQGKLFEFIDFIQNYQEVIKHISFLTLYSVLGQVFIFYCINCFSPRVLSVVTTTRKFFTVLLSIIIHNHELEQIQWIGIILVALGISWELFMGMSSRIPAEKKKESYQRVPLEETTNEEESEQEKQNHQNGKKHRKEQGKQQHPSL